MSSINNPDPPYDPKARRQFIHLAWLTAAIGLVLLCFMVASFLGLLPTWVSKLISAAVLPVICLVFWRADSLRKRLRTRQG